MSHKSHKGKAYQREACSEQRIGQLGHNVGHKVHLSRRGGHNGGL